MHAWTLTVTHTCTDTVCHSLRPAYAAAARAGLLVEPASSCSSSVPMNSAIAVLARVRLGCRRSGSGRRPPPVPLMRPEVGSIAVSFDVGVRSLMTEGS